MSYSDALEGVLVPPSHSTAPGSDLASTMAAQPQHASDSSTELKPFRHEPLDQGKNEIRLITNAPSTSKNGNAPLQYQMRTFSLDACPKYRALSYTWGSAVDLQVVIVNDAQLKIRRTLYDFLLRLEAAGEQDDDSKWFWVDQVSIDQENVLERNHQVGLMQEIYSKAHAVHAWLGEDHGDDVEVLQSIVHGRPDRRFDVPLYRRDEIADDDLSTRIKAFCRRPYWSRLWIIQELILAAQVVYWCGRSRVVAPWTDEDSIPFPSDLIAGLDQHVDAVQTLLIHSIESAARVWDKQGHRKLGSTQRPYLITLDEAIRLYSHYDCQDAKDKIYGLQSIVLDRQRLEVDYSKPVELIFEEVVVVIISDSVRHLPWHWSPNSMIEECIRKLRDALLRGLGYDSDTLMRGVRMLFWSRCATMFVKHRHNSSVRHFRWPSSESMTRGAETANQKHLSLAFIAVVYEARTVEYERQGVHEPIQDSLMRAAISCGFVEQNGFLINPDDKPFPWSK